MLVPYWHDVKIPSDVMLAHMNLAFERHSSVLLAQTHQVKHLGYVILYTSDLGSHKSSYHLPSLLDSYSECRVFATFDGKAPSGVAKDLRSYVTIEYGNPPLSTRRID